MKRYITKKGSSTVILAMVFTAFAVCIAGSIWIAREMVIRSECEAFGRIWARAILSEYDRHLLEDYGMMAYFGSDSEVAGTVDAYLKYSAAGKLRIRIGKTSAELAGYELGDPANFRKAMNKGLAGSTAGSILNGRGRQKRTETQEADENSEPAPGNIIGNQVVLDTLPSRGLNGTPSEDSILEKAKQLGTSDGIRSAVMEAGTDVIFIWQHFGNHVTKAEDKKAYLTNEWEYIIKGSPDDHANHESCKRRLFAVRNALNLLALYQDPKKVELITTAAELITPGPLGSVTQLLIAEAWAVLETEADLKDLYDYGRVPVFKTSDQWQTGLGAVLDSDSVRGKLDEESRELLDENRGEIEQLPGAAGAGQILTEGLNYDEYLMLMILAMNENTRVLRIMDLVQLNMKYRYYRDFNLMEYYLGVRFTLQANGREYSFEDWYR